jgi:hypothetical protein
MQSEQINELAKALSTAQAKIENATLNKINPHFKSKYADLSSVIDSIRAALSSNGIAVTQPIEMRDGGMVLRTVLIHAGSGQWIASEFPLPNVTKLQELGSALTYARRYSLSSMVCNSADEDDDANAAEDGKQKVETKGRAPAPSKVSIAAPAASKYDRPVVLQISDGPKRWIEFGQELIAGVQATGEPVEWATLNKNSLDMMKIDAPKVYERVMANMTPQREAAE